MIATVFDTETTGLIENPARKLDSQPEIISIAIQNVNLETGEIFDIYYKEFKPVKPLSKNIIEITKITNEKLESASPIMVDLPYIALRLMSAPLIIGQNIRFDMDMIELECKRNKYSFFKWPKILDLVQNTIHLKGYRLSLTNLHLELFGTAFESAHDASVDCTITSKCAIELFKRGLL
jgi:DNA polymerase III alpha subunit (gram-positive type)